MDKSILDAISADMNLKVDFLIILQDEIASDCEPPRKKWAQLCEAYKENPAVTDKVLMAICGWTMQSLCEETLKG